MSKKFWWRSQPYYAKASKGILRLGNHSQLNNYINPLKRLACHTKPWRSMVGGVGFEPTTPSL